LNKYTAFVENELLNRDIEFVCDKQIPVEEKPFNFGRFSKCDFYIPKLDLYIRVGGKMSIESMFEAYSFLANKDIHFMLIDGVFGKHLVNDDDENDRDDRIFKSIDIQISSIEKVIEGSLPLDNLTTASIMCMQIYMDRWVEKYRDNNLNLLDFHDICTEVDPEADLYTNIDRNTCWFTGYPENN